MTSKVTRTAAASADQAIKHFESLLAFETDCWDVHHAIQNNRKDFVLIDVRSEILFAQGHLPRAINIPSHKISDAVLSELPSDQLIVVYCAGPHCNGTEKAAIEIAKHQRKVKKMIGGITGWIDEGFDLVKA